MLAHRHLQKNAELIDTLWNVNAFVPVALVTFNGINRYIMECKYR